MSEITKNRIIRIPYEPDNREAWLELRKRGIGGSDSATVVGLNPFSSRLELYADKQGLLPDKEDNEAMYWSRALEDNVAAKFEEVTGKKTQRVNFVLMNEKYPYSLANIDRRVVGEKAVLEIKCTSAFNKSDFENGEIPMQYLVQCYHYMAVCDYDRAYLAVLVGGQKFYHYTIERDDKEIDALMQAEKDFWEQHIQPQREPAPDGSESAQRVLERMERMDGTALLMDLEATFDQYQLLNDQIKSIEKERDKAKQEIIQGMGVNGRGQSYTWKCSYLPQSRTSVDSKALATKYPEVFAQVAKNSGYSVFRVTKKKEDK